MLKLLLFFLYVNHKNKALKNGHIQLFAYNFKVLTDPVLSILKCKPRIPTVNKLNNTKQVFGNELRLLLCLDVCFHPSICHRPLVLTHSLVSPFV